MPGPADPAATAARAEPAHTQVHADVEVDVVVVGAGPAGSTTAYHLARTGLSVALLEKTAFPREKVCGDGLTPRAVRQLVAMGIDTSEAAGWKPNKGLRVLGGGSRVLLPWPELTSFPGHGLVRPRTDLDALLALRAQEAGALLHQRTRVTGPLLDDRTGRVVGVHAADAEGRERTYRGRLVVAADGGSSRLSLAVGRRRDPRRPVGVAVRTYVRTPRHDDDWLETWLDLGAGAPAVRRLGVRGLLPGYGWVFPMHDGTANVGLGVLTSTYPAYGELDLRAMLRGWLAAMPDDVVATDDVCAPVRGAALPEGLGRGPQYADGLLLVGDAAGLVNPFNGEGIAYAMESGALAAEVAAQALARPTEAGREAALAAYPAALRQSYAGYYALGRAFTRIIARPRAMGVLVEHGLPHPRAMRFAMKLLANLTDPHDGDAADRLVAGLSRISALVAPEPAGAR
ncbi:MAG: geranylgeranyl reductase family protein [Motilibacteraceae bacterium]